MDPRAPAEPAPAPPAPGGDPVTEVLAAWAIAIAAVWAGWRFLPETPAAALAPLLWIGVAIAAHLAKRRPLEPAGLAWKQPLRSLRLTATYAAVFLPLYGAGFYVFHRFEPVAGETWRVPSLAIPLVGFVGNLVYAALPEEIFFRGFVQPRLAELWPGEKPRRVLGIPLTRAVVAAAALFALTHVAFLANPVSLQGLERLTTFFPGLLFGALREETGDVVAPALFHAACNAWLSSLQSGYLT